MYIASAASPTYQGAVQSRPSNAPPKSPPRRSRGFFSSLFACCTCGTAEDIESDRSVPPAVPARVEGVAAIPAKAEAEAARIRAGDVLNSGAGSLDSLNGNGTKQQDRKWLLRPAAPEHRGKKCLVLDLDETLVHSSFKVSSRNQTIFLVNLSTGGSTGDSARRLCDSGRNRVASAQRLCAETTIRRPVFEAHVGDF